MKLFIYVLLVLLPCSFAYNCTTLDQCTKPTHIVHCDKVTHIVCVDGYCTCALNDYTCNILTDCQSFLGGPGEEWECPFFNRHCVDGKCVCRTII